MILSILGSWTLGCEIRRSKSTASASTIDKNLLIIMRYSSDARAYIFKELW
jgi:hypothetical protein